MFTYFARNAQEEALQKIATQMQNLIESAVKMYTAGGMTQAEFQAEMVRLNRTIREQ